MSVLAGANCVRRQTARLMVARVMVVSVIIGMMGQMRVSENNQWLRHCHVVRTVQG